MQFINLRRRPERRVDRMNRIYRIGVYPVHPVNPVGTLAVRRFLENEPQMNADERRFVVPGLGRGADSLAAGMRWWRCDERGLGFDEGKAQVEGIEDIVYFNEF